MSLTRQLIINGEHVPAQSGKTTDDISPWTNEAYAQVSAAGPEDVTRAVPSQFRNPGDAILLLGTTQGHLGGSAYWAEVLDTVAGSPPPINLDTERSLQRLLVAAAQAGWLVSAHDLSDGGLAVALAECCIGGPWSTTTFGADIDLKAHADHVSDEGWFFGEDAARVLVSVSPADVAALQKLGGEHGIPCHFMGLVDEPGTDLVFRRAGSEWRWPTARLRSIYQDAIPRRMRQTAAAGEG
ncbi:MAG TPA: AIR synthase-related protein [Gemmatimonadales bacterium]|nr:AIR synthase-related protein [Gemmatimonadales bacterium]